MRIKCLAVGSCGFILSNLIRRSSFLKEEINFIGIDKIGSNERIHNIYYNKNNSFYLNDCSNAAQLDVIFSIEKPDVVLLGFSADNLVENLKALLNILDCCIKYNVKKVIYLSHVFKESSLKGLSEVNAENLLNVYSKYLPILIFKFSDTFGPRQELPNLIPLIIKCMINESQVEINNWGKSELCLSYVDDIVNAILLLIKKDHLGIVHASNNFIISEIELIQLVETSCNMKLNKSFNDGEAVQAQRINNSAIEEIGWEPSAKFVESIEKTCSWYLNNKWFIK